jgi:uncharacterized protein YjbI with pentapeptide repeats
MANEEHLKILKQGVEAWNQWREEHPGVWPDLHGADLDRAELSGAHLSQADLGGAHLDGVDLSWADLGGVDLRGADLSEADLRDADLFEADLSEANLNWADLIEVDLRGASLTWASLNGANLRGANLQEAIVASTTFADLDLSVAKGLDAVKHVRPSTIGLDTLYKSRGQIPEVFLRGCGVPDNFITYMGSLTGKAFEYYSCFISYSHMDEAFAQRLHADLQARGVRCWFAPEDMKIGDKIRPRIDESIRVHDKLLLILSQHSVASAWVEHEVEHALDLEGERKAPVLFPIRLDDAVLDSQIGWAGNVRRGRHIGDFCAWKDHDAYQRAFDRLLRDLKAEEG